MGVHSTKAVSFVIYRSRSGGFGSRWWQGASQETSVCRSVSVEPVTSRVSAAQCYDVSSSVAFSV